MSGSVFGNAEPLHVPRTRESAVICNIRYVDFMSSSEELAAMNSLNIQTLNYVLHKLALKDNNILLNLKDHMCAINSGSMYAETSTFVYLSVLDIHADTVEAMSQVAAMLYKEYIVTTQEQHT